MRAACTVSILPSMSVPNVSEQIKQHEALADRVLAEQVALMCRLTTSPLFASTILGLMFCWLTFEDYGLIPTLTWYGALMLVTLIRWRVAKAYLSHPQHERDVHRWRLMMLLLAAVAGAVWSVPGSLMLPTDREKEIVVTILLIGATASGVGSQAPVRHAYTCLLIPFVLPYAIVQFAMGGERVISGLGMLIYIPVVLVIAYRQTDSVEQQIRLAIENEALVNELRKERDRANQANHELHAQVEQQRRSTEHIASLNRDLESQAIELRRVNSDLEGFSYSVSHDLRAPLRAIHGFASLLAQQPATQADKDSRHFLTRINENILRMSTLIDDLLAFSKCGRQPLEMSKLEMASLARTAAAEAVSAHESLAPPEIIIGSLPSAWGDPHLLLQVWRNLLDNAVKYSSKVESPRITVSGREEGRYAVFEVRDNGVGFDSNYSELLFGVFQRLHRISDYPGSGVGLAIVQRIVNRHDGEVWAKSEPNQGATFGFSLPLVMSTHHNPDFAESTALRD
jgi:signal transduction histidine kinase